LVVPNRFFPNEARDVFGHWEALVFARSANLTSQSPAHVLYRACLTWTKQLPLNYNEASVRPNSGCRANHAKTRPDSHVPRSLCQPGTNCGYATAYKRGGEPPIPLSSQNLSIRVFGVFQRIGDLIWGRATHSRTRGLQASVARTGRQLPSPWPKRPSSTMTWAQAHRDQQYKVTSEKMVLSYRKSRTVRLIQVEVQIHLKMASRSHVLSRGEHFPTMNARGALPPEFELEPDDARGGPRPGPSDFAGLMIVEKENQPVGANSVSSTGLTSSRTSRPLT